MTASNGRRLVPQEKNLRMAKRKEREWILSSEPKNIHYHKLRIPAQYEFTIKGINKMKFSL